MTSVISSQQLALDKWKIGSLPLDPATFMSMWIQLSESCPQIHCPICDTRTGSMKLHLIRGADNDTFQVCSECWDSLSVKFIGRR